MPGGPGNLAWQMPPREDDIMRRTADLQRMVREQASAQTGQAMQIGAGGILVNGGGSITIQGTGSFNTNGAISTTGPFTAASVSSSGPISGDSLTITNAGSVGGNLSVGGLSTGGSISASAGIAAATGTFNGGLFSTAVYSTVVSGTRTATWTQNDGTMGTSPSSIRFKTNVQPVAWTDSRVQSILSASAKYYQYKAEVARRDDPTSPAYVGPDYHVHTELGYIAEDLHAAGLWEVVIYERDEDGSPKLDATGAVIPFGVHYELLGIYALEAAAWLWVKLQAQQADIAAIKARLGM
jgi:hypothetical protein